LKKETFEMLEACEFVPEVEDGDWFVRFGKS